MTRFTKPTAGDTVATILYITAFVAALAAGAFFFLPKYWYLWGLTVVGGLYVLLLCQTRSFGYRGANCGNEFMIRMAANFTAVNAFSKRYVKCPACGERTWTEVLKRVKDGEVK